MAEPLYMTKPISNDTAYYTMIKLTNSKQGFYTVEAAIFLPLFVLAVLTLGYFIRFDGTWERAMHEEFDRCSYSASVAYCGMSGSVNSNVHSRRVEENSDLAMPLGFGQSFTFRSEIRYRDFVGLKEEHTPLGADALETSEAANPVWIFPQSGTRYHCKSCTYVQASVHSSTLNSSVKSRYSPCGMCHSETLSPGSIVFCFYGDDTSYHRGSCRAINRHVIKVDKSDATNKGYSPCSKCGG